MNLCYRQFWGGGQTFLHREIVSDRALWLCVCSRSSLWSFCHCIPSLIYGYLRSPSILKVVMSFDTSKDAEYINPPIRYLMLNANQMVKKDDNKISDFYKKVCYQSTVHTKVYSILLTNLFGLKPPWCSRKFNRRYYFHQCHATADYYWGIQQQIKFRTKKA